MSVETFNYTGSLQTFTIPAGVTAVTIHCLGAGGGSTDQGVLPGKGVSMQGDFLVAEGEKLSVLVGGAGSTAFGEYLGGGGGGGTFIWRGTGKVTLENLLLAAGGGGGASHYTSVYGVNAVLTTSGTAGNGGGAGGSGGSGGFGGLADGDGGGGAGAGILTDGGNGQNGEYSDGGGGGVAIQSGGAGGAGQYPDENGGFGGGGGGTIHGGGGGGGYSGGGGGGTAEFSGGGGGGGSYNGGTNPLNTPGVGTGDGLVTFTYTAGPVRGLPLSLLAVGAGGTV